MPCQFFFVSVYDTLIAYLGYNYCFFNDVWWIVPNKLEGMWKETVAKQFYALSRHVLGRTEDGTEVWGMQMSGPSFEPKTLTFQEGRNADNWTATLNLDTYQSNLCLSWRVYFLLKLTHRLQWMCKYVYAVFRNNHIPRDTTETVKHQSNCDPFHVVGSKTVSLPRGVLVNFTPSACGLTAHWAEQDSELLAGYMKVA